MPRQSERASETNNPHIRRLIRPAHPSAHRALRSRTTGNRAHRTRPRSLAPLHPRRTFAPQSRPTHRPRRCTPRHAPRSYRGQPIRAHHLRRTLPRQKTTQTRPLTPSIPSAPLCITTPTRSCVCSSARTRPARSTAGASPERSSRLPPPSSCSARLRPKTNSSTPWSRTGQSRNCWAIPHQEHTGGVGGS